MATKPAINDNCKYGCSHDANAPRLPTAKFTRSWISSSPYKGDILLLIAGIQPNAVV